MSVTAPAQSALDARVATLLAHDRPVPRYTSYPTVPAWSTSPPDDAWEQLLSRLDGPAQLYAHIPFCRRQCAYCGCNMAVSRNQRVGDRYLDVLQRQLDLIPALQAEALHLGGGTPTWLDGPQLTRLLSMFVSHFGTLRVSVEADPETLDDDRMAVLSGIERLSLGVQTLDPVVTASVNRDQTAETVAWSVHEARRRGIRSLNIDLMYGLPHQTAERFASTLDQVAELRPERIAVFGYAHVPQMMKHQRGLTDLPSPEERARLALLAEQKLLAAGYAQVGFDHYALPDDPLASGPIERGFMGYTPRTLPIIGLGPSSISAVDGVYLQNGAALGPWLRGEALGEVHRFYASTPADRARGRIIEAILCRGQAEVDWSLYPEARARLIDELPDVVDLDAESLTVRPGLMMLARNVASAFDAWGGRSGSRAI